MNAIDKQPKTVTETGPAHAPILFSPFTFKGGTIANNRFFKSALSEQLGDAHHLPDQRLVNVYRRWALGNTGILVTGNVMIDRTALGEPKNVVLDADQDLAPFRAWAEAVTGSMSNGHIWMQLNHPGKQSPKQLSPTPVAPSAVALGRGLEAAFAKPRALEEQEILDIIEKFAVAAARAKEAGFTGVQIHGAHGYLVSQFLSPHHNRRSDQWGGSAENRRRFAVEIYRAIRARVGNDFVVAIKMNSADFQKGGFSGEEAFDLIKVLSDEGIDMIEISGGNYESPAMTGAKQSTQEREAYFLEFAEKARNLTDVPLAVTGGFRSVAAMEQALSSNAVDFIGIGRPLTIDPELPLHAEADPAYKADVGNPTTGLRIVDTMFMLAITYYESQIARMGRNRNPDKNKSAWWTVIDSALTMGALAVRKRRA